MNRRLNNSRILIVSLLTIIGLLLAGCDQDDADKTYTIGVINLAPDLENIIEGFKEGMAELGYIESDNITYIYQGRAESIEELDLIAQGLVESDVDLILSMTTPATQAVQRATADTEIPVVFVPVTDPVGAGIVDSLLQPGGNITGVFFGLQEDKRLEWLLQVVPSIEQVYIPYNPEDRSATLALEAAKEAAAVLDIELIIREASSEEEIMAAVDDVPEEADAVFILPDSLVAAHISDFIALQLPTSGPQPGLVESVGALTSYGFEPFESGKQAANMAGRIFQGAKPAEMPVETAEFYTALNLRVAEALGLDVPDSAIDSAAIIVR